MSQNSPPEMPPQRASGPDPRATTTRVKAESKQRWAPAVLVVGLYAVALGVRVAVALASGMSQPTANDEPEYFEPAVFLSEGQGYRIIPQQSPDEVAYPTAYRMPGPALFLALNFLVFGASVELARWLALIVASTSAPLMYLFSRRFLPSGAAACAGLACALYPTWVHFSRFIYAEPYFIPASLLALVLTLRAIESGGRWSLALLAGLCWGGVTLIRPHGLFMGLLVAVYCLWRLGWRPAAALMLGVLVPLVPWVARNYAVFGRPVVLATEGGETLLGANNAHVLDEPEEHGMWVSLNRMPEYGERLRPIRDEIERDEEQRNLAIEFLRDHPREMPTLMAYKLWRWLTPMTGSGGMIRILVLCSYGVLLILLFAGVFVGAYRSLPALHLVLLWTALLVAVTAVYWGGLTRGRLSLELMWIPWGTCAAYLLFARVRQRSPAQPVGK
jgi:Dolichyl-phosphate-mannose-protein mannosyltransferase